MVKLASSRFQNEVNEGSAKNLRNSVFDYAFLRSQLEVNMNNLNHSLFQFISWSFLRKETGRIVEFWRCNFSHRSKLLTTESIVKAIDIHVFLIRKFWKNIRTCDIRILESICARFTFFYGDSSACHSKTLSIFWFEGVVTPDNSQNFEMWLRKVALTFNSSFV